MQEKLTAKDQEAPNNQETVKRLHKSCRDLLKKSGNDTPLKPDGSYIITPAKKIGKKLNLYFFTDPIAGGILNREKALSGPLFVYICRKNTKNSESMMLIELNSSGKYKIDSYIEKNGRLHREEITFSDSQVLENCGSFIVSLKERYGEKKLKPKQEFTINSG